jgi:membrane protease YdiL (CAAX protease family)
MATDLENDVAAWSARDAWRLLGYFLGVHVLLGIALRVAGVRAPFGAGMILAQQASMVAVVWYVLCFKKRRPTATLGLRPVDRLRTHLVWLAAGGVVMTFLLTFAGLVVTAALYHLLGREMPGNDRLFTRATTPLGRALLIVVAIAGAPISEEVTFRGVLYRWLRVRKGARFAAVVSAVAFGVVHLQPSLFLAHVGAGLALAHTVEVSGSLYPAMLLHAVVNAIAVLAARS